MSDVSNPSSLSAAASMTALNSSTVANDDTAAAQNASRLTIDITNPLIPTSVLRALYEKGITLEYQIGDEFKEYENPLPNKYQQEINQYLNSSRYTALSGNRYRDNKTGVTFRPGDMEHEDRIRFIIDNRVDRGLYELTPGGQIKQVKNTAGNNLNPPRIFEEAELGFQLQTFVIGRLQDQIKEINELIGNLTLLNDWITQNQITHEDNTDQVWHTELWTNSEGSYKTFMERQGYPNWPESTKARDFMIKTNNDFVGWLGITKNAEKVSNFAAFGTGKFDPNEWRARVSSTSFTNATEKMRNLVKEKSTQAEQLGTDFQTRNSRYNAVIEAMTNYTKTYFGAVKNFVS